MTLNLREMFEDNDRKRRGGKKIGARGRDTIELLQRFGSSMHIEDGSFAEACVNTNTIAELIDALAMPEADPDDLARWNLTPEEWRKQIFAALLAKQSRAARSEMFDPDLISVLHELRAALRWALAQLPEPQSAMSDEGQLSDYDENYHQAEAAIAKMRWK